MLKDSWHRSLAEGVKKYPILSLIVLLQICTIIYVNLRLLSCSIGDDASMAYLQAIEMAKQGKLLPDHWYMVTTLALDTPVPIAALLYKISHNFFLAYGLANILCSGFLAVVIWHAADALEMSFRGKLLALCLFLTPYLSYADGVNPIRYFHMVLFSLNVYSVKTATLLLIWLTFSHLDSGERSARINICCIATILLCLLSGVSSGVYILVFGLAPVFLLYFIDRLKQNDWKEHMTSGAFLVICAAVVMGGKFFCQHVIGYVARDGLAVWTSLGVFWDNLTSILLGYFELTGALPGGSCSILTKEGIVFAFRLGLSLVILIGGIVLLVRLVKKACKGTVFAWAFIGNLIIFILCYTKYGASIFEVRYLIPMFILLILFSAKQIDSILAHNISCRLCLGCGFIACVLITNIASYDVLQKSENPREAMDEIKEVVSEYSSPVVYVAGSDNYHLGQIMRVYDESKIYKPSSDMMSSYPGGTYSYFDENSEYEGQTLLISSESSFQTLPAYLTTKYKLVHRIADGTICIYSADENPVDFSVGITDNDINIDYPYTQGIVVSEHAIIEDSGTLLTDGTGGCMMWGPYTATPAGTYDFTINYEVVSALEGTQSAGFFDVKVGPEVIEQTELPTTSSAVTISAVSFDELVGSGLLEYRVTEYEGAVLRVKSVVIERVS